MFGTLVARVVFSPGGAAVNSQGRQPLGRTERWFFLFSPGGAADWRPSGAKRQNSRHQGLAPLAINCRPSGAKDKKQPRQQVCRTLLPGETAEKRTTDGTDNTDKDKKCCSLPLRPTLSSSPAAWGSEGGSGDELPQPLAVRGFAATKFVYGLVPRKISSHGATISKDNHGLTINRPANPSATRSCGGADRSFRA